jgi:hypothetical protein
VKKNEGEKSVSQKIENTESEVTSFDRAPETGRGFHVGGISCYA